MPYDAVLFDLDDTLADREPPFRRLMRQLYLEEEALSSAHPWDEAIAAMLKADEDGYAVQRMKMKYAGLDRAAAVVVSSEFGKAKPDPDIYAEGLRLIGMPTGRHVLFCGDNPRTDIEGARMTGLATVWVHRGRSWPATLAPPEAVVAHVTDIRGLLTPVQG